MSFCRTVQFEVLAHLPRHVSRSQFAKHPFAAPMILMLVLCCTYSFNLGQKLHSNLFHHRGELMIMATSTFDKNIYIDDAAADVLIGLLNKPAPPRPDLSGKFRELTEEDDRCCLQNLLARMSEKNSKK
jgi:hypothetical protein